MGNVVCEKVVLFRGAYCSVWIRVLVHECVYGRQKVSVIDIDCCRSVAGVYCEREQVGGTVMLVIGLLMDVFFFW